MCGLGKARIDPYICCSLDGRHTAWPLRRALWTLLAVQEDSHRTLFGSNQCSSVSSFFFPPLFVCWLGWLVVYLYSICLSVYMFVNLSVCRAVCFCFLKTRFIVWFKTAMKTHRCVVVKRVDTLYSAEWFMCSGAMNFFLTWSAATKFVSVSSQDGIRAFGNSRTRFAQSLGSFLETIPMCFWLKTDRSRPWREERRPHPFSIPVWWSML